MHAFAKKVCICAHTCVCSPTYTGRTHKTLTLSLSCLSLHLQPNKIMQNAQHNTILQCLAKAGIVNQRCCNGLPILRTGLLFLYSFIYGFTHFSPQKCWQTKNKANNINNNDDFGKLSIYISTLHEKNYIFM